MPKVSESVGFACPVAGCGGFMRVKSTSHSADGRSVLRRRVCRVCRARQTTSERSVGPVEMRAVAGD